MTENQKTWAQSRSRLRDAVAALGYPEELADLMASQLKSPKAMDRMASYIYQARPRTMEMLMDEMLAICDEIQTWKEKKESELAQSKYNTLLFYGLIGQGGGDDGPEEEGLY